MSAITSYNMTGNAYIDGVLGNFKWASNNISYSFPTNGSYYGTNYANTENSTNFGALSAAQQTMAREALRIYSTVANLTFSPLDETTTQHADLRYGQSDETPTAWAYMPSVGDEGGDVWFNRSNGYFVAPLKGGYAYQVFLHETGHALGLDHPHEGNVMPLDRDSLEYSIMSCRSYKGGSATSGFSNEAWGYDQSPMMYDIAALQQMYGANYATNSGNTTYSWSPSTGEMFVNGAGQGRPGDNRILLTVWDGGGNDTYDFSNYAGGLKIDLRPGEWTTTSAGQLARLKSDGSQLAIGNIANALLNQGDMRALIENAIGGSGNNTMTGNDGINLLKGGAGSDKLYGLAGNDVLDGGLGADTLSGGAGADIFDFNTTKDSLSSARDTIQDFVRGTDRIDLRTIDASTKSSGNQAFSFIGTKSFTGHAGELNFVSSVLSGDVNGDGSADFRIKIAVSSLASGDLYL